MTFAAVANDPNVELAMSIAKAAGEQLLVRPEHLEIDTKSSATDVVTQMDREAEAYIVAQLKKHRPDDAILGEEGLLTWFTVTVMQNYDAYFIDAWVFWMFKCQLLINGKLDCGSSTSNRFCILRLNF